MKKVKGFFITIMIAIAMGFAYSSHAGPPDELTAQNTNDSINAANNTEEILTTVYKDVRLALIGMGEALKVGAEHVYTIMVRQQLVKSICWMFTGIVPMLFLLIFGKSVWKWATKNSEASEGFNVFVCFLFYIFTICPAILSMCYIDIIITGFINPEYGAIKDIMEFISK